ncbi:FAD-binding oxidoreductase [Streptomyces sp. OF3]|uniref:FAD-binding oxidoreductase n=1 Tax=Streptomyces alkaliterrae TaxID=2213162 RepID=A0A5P0YUX9_9ACTN|nr:FAD-binding oxidoreductase [Streptomyces alkaliterrae]MBB1261425.1 FAD-binding oxidoreductase [Streptomyces alkaliterrae]MQS03760.1 FAD-binding protein [Streptomyces alkaliterrae]
MAEFAAGLRGRLIRPEDSDYDPARSIWNAMVDRRPALIVRCAHDADVAAAVDFARDQGLLLAVRGGGHGVAGHAVCDGGLVVDLSQMRGVEVDVERRTARARGGCTLGDVDRATQRHGLATALGVVSETGVAGLTLSGGMGWLRRKYGLSCDNLASATLVTADGRVRGASEEENPDLFWAIRGGGGNFGVVTSFEYRLHVVGPEVFLCFVLYPLSHAREVLRFCERYTADAPEDVAPVAVLGRVPEAEEFPPEARGELFVALLAVHPGGPAEGERVLRPLREITEPLGDVSGAMPYTEAQKALDADYPDGGRYYWKSLNVGELSDELVERLATHVTAAPSPASTIDVWFQGGAMARVGEEETAFANRTAPYLLGLEANWEEEADSDANMTWVRGVFADLHGSFSTGGLYLNFPGFLEEGDKLLREGYGGNRERLAEIKATYDPTNLFRLNANITPRP